MTTTKFSQIHPYEYSLSLFLHSTASLSPTHTLLNLLIGLHWTWYSLSLPAQLIGGMRKSHVIRLSIRGYMKHQIFPRSSQRCHFIALYFISSLWFSTTCPPSFPCWPLWFHLWIHPRSLQFLQKTVSQAPCSLLLWCISPWALEVWKVY